MGWGRGAGVVGSTARGVSYKRVSLGMMLWGRVPVTVTGALRIQKSDIFRQTFSDFKGREWRLSVVEVSVTDSRVG